MKTWIVFALLSTLAGDLAAQEMLSAHGPQAVRLSLRFYERMADVKSDWADANCHAAPVRQADGSVQYLAGCVREATFEERLAASSLDPSFSWLPLLGGLLARSPGTVARVKDPRVAAAVVALGLGATVGVLVNQNEYEEALPFLGQWAQRAIGATRKLTLAFDYAALSVLALTLPRSEVARPTVLPHIDRELVKPTVLGYPSDPPIPPLVSLPGRADPGAKGRVVLNSKAGAAKDVPVAPAKRDSTGAKDVSNGKAASVAIPTLRPLEEIVDDLKKLEEKLAVATGKKARSALEGQKSELRVQLREAVKADEGKVGEIASAIGSAKILDTERDQHRAELEAAVLAGGETLSEYLERATMYFEKRLPLITLIRGTPDLMAADRKELEGHVLSASSKNGLERLGEWLPGEVIRRQCKALLAGSEGLRSDAQRRLNALITKTPTVESAQDLLGQIRHETEVAKRAISSRLARESRIAREIELGRKKSELSENLAGIEGISERARTRLQAELDVATNHEALEVLEHRLEAIRNAFMGVHDKKLRNAVVSALIRERREFTEPLARHLNSAPVPSAEVIQAILRRYSR